MDALDPGSRTHALYLLHFDHDEQNTTSSLLPFDVAPKASP